VTKITKVADELMAELPASVKAVLAEQQGAGGYAYRKAVAAANELANRKIEALNLYRPTEIQDQYHRSTAVEVLFQAGNQVGKSLAGFIEDARAVTNQDPYNKYPSEGTLIILGYKESHIGKVVYPYLFRSGAFKIIRDLETGLWRTYRPWVPQDKAREKEAKPAPPLIPNRFIKEISWAKKNRQIFSEVKLTTGWTIMAFSSRAKPDQGFKADLAHIDEDILDESWYGELMARLTMRNGKMRWTALPHNENDALTRVAERGIDQEQLHARGGPEPSTVIVRATIYDNPHMTDEARRTNVERWKAVSDAEFRKRALGELVTDSVRMYPTWSKDSHAVQHYGDAYGGLFKDYIETKRIPPNWCLSMIVDPGHATCAVLFVATPPIGETHLVYDELYINQSTALIFGQEVEKKVRDKTFQRFIMDAHGGRLTSMETGLRPQESYEQQLKERNILCVETGFRFQAGVDAIQYREEILREHLSFTPSGVPRIVFDFDNCYNLDKEMKRFRKVKKNGYITDKGNRVETHLVECLEYFVAGDTEYVQPPAPRKSLTESQRRVKAFLDRQRMKRGRNANTVILGPQGIK
jgi:hypothetical protein